MKKSRYKILFLGILFLGVLMFFLNYNKITIDYDLIKKKEIKISYWDYYFKYLNKHYDRKIISIKNKDNSFYLEYKENDRLRKITYFKNKYGHYVNFLKFDGEDGYELSNFQRVFIYNDNYAIMFYDPINSGFFIEAEIYEMPKEGFKNTYICKQISFKKPISFETIKETNFNKFYEVVQNHTIKSNVSLIFDLENNLFYASSTLNSKENSKENSNDLNNAQSIFSPFFEPMGDKDFFNLIHGFN